MTQKANRYIIRRSDATIDGPFTVAELRRMAQAGQVQPEDELARRGTEAWLPAWRAKGLFPAGVVAAARESADLLQCEAPTWESISPPAAPVIETAHTLPIRRFVIAGVCIGLIVVLASGWYLHHINVVSARRVAVGAVVREQMRIASAAHRRGDDTAEIEALHAVVSVSDDDRRIMDEWVLSDIDAAVDLLAQAEAHHERELAKGKALRALDAVEHLIRTGAPTEATIQAKAKKRLAAAEADQERRNSQFFQSDVGREALRVVQQGSANWVIPLATESTRGIARLLAASARDYGGTMAQLLYEWQGIVRDRIDYYDTITQVDESGHLGKNAVLLLRSLQAFYMASFHIDVRAIAAINAMILGSVILDDAIDYESIVVEARKFLQYGWREQVAAALAEVEEDTSLFEGDERHAFEERVAGARMEFEKYWEETDQKDDGPVGRVESEIRHVYAEGGIHFEYDPELEVMTKKPNPGITAVVLSTIETSSISLSIIRADAIVPGMEANFIGTATKSLRASGISDPQVSDLSSTREIAGADRSGTRIHADVGGGESLEMEVFVFEVNQSSAALLVSYTSGDKALMEHYVRTIADSLRIE